jgi:hypothetical protein
MLPDKTARLVAINKRLKTVEAVPSYENHEDAAAVKACADNLERLVRQLRKNLKDSPTPPQPGGR